MFFNLIKKLSSSLYVQIWEERIKVTDIVNGHIYDEKPLVALETTKKGQLKVVAIDNSASLISDSNIEIINPFSHPRVLFADFTVGEKLLQYIFRELSGNKYLNPSPEVIIHPMEKTEGGLTMIELRAFKEVAFGAGARDVVVYQGEELSITSINFNDLAAKNNELT